VSNSSTRSSVTLPIRLPKDFQPNWDVWESAYLRFSTPEQERRKFHRRYRQLGVTEWPRDLEILEIFAGRGNGLVALSELGFTGSTELTSPLDWPQRIRAPIRFMCVTADPCLCPIRAGMPLWSRVACTT